MSAPKLPPDAQVRDGLFNWLQPGQKVRCVEPERVYRNVVEPLSSSIDLTQVHTIARLVQRHKWTYFAVKGYDGVLFSAESAGDGVELWTPVEDE